MANDNTTPEQQAKINSLLEEERDTVADIVSLHEKINTGLFRRIQLQGKVEELIEKSNVELLNAKKFAEGKTGTEKTEADLIVRSIQQRLLGYNKELDLLRKMNLTALAPMIALWTIAFELFQKMDKAVVSFNMHMGFIRRDSSEIQKIAQNMAIQFMHIGVTIDGVYKSWEALSHVMGSAYIVSKDLVQTTSILAAQLGVSEEISAVFLKNLAGISNSTLQSQKGMAYLAANMSRAAGVPLNEVMKEVATHSDTTLTMISRVPAAVIKAAVEFRRLNTTLGDVAKASRDILNFTDNVQAEMEASVLLGHSINLQKARELAYNKDLVGSNREILKLTEQNRFDKMDVFQQEAFARATGRSVDELLRMVQADREWTNAKRNGTDAQKAQIANYEKLRDANKSVLADRSRQFELELMQSSNQERLVSITNKWNQILAKAGAIFLPLIDYALSIVPPMLSVLVAVTSIYFGLYRIGQLLKTVGTGAAVFFGAIDKVSAGFAYVARFGGVLMKIIGFIDSIGLKFIKFISPVIDFLGIAGKFAGTFGKAIPVVGEVIIALQFVYEYIKLVIDYFEHWSSMSWGERIYNGIALPFKALYAVLIQPFVDFGRWFMEKSGLAANSPSEIGLAIVHGLVSVQNMLFNALTYPFRHGFAWILDHIPGMSNIAGKLREGFGEVSTTVNHKMQTVSDIASNAPKVEAESSAKKETTVNSKEQTNNSDTGNNLLQGILKAINDLNENLKAGNISVNLDGSLVSTKLARSIEFKGNYGVN